MPSLLIIISTNIVLFAIFTIIIKIIITNQQKDNIKLTNLLFTELESKLLDKNTKEFRGNRIELTSFFTTMNYSITKKIGENSEQVAHFQKSLTKDLFLFRESSAEIYKKNFHDLTMSIENSLEKINNRVREKLDEGFKKTNETFQNVIQRLARIDEAQKKIETLSGSVVSLQDILTDKKSRGIFGEVQLNQILYSVFGEKNDKIFQTQYKFSTGKIVDAILFTPQPTGNISIDSKFPLDNYKRMLSSDYTKQEQNEFRRAFVLDVKKQISDISTKYIIPNETSNQAIMFLPAEAVFAELHAYHSELINYAFKQKVSIASPTTFMAILTTLQLVLNNIEQKKYADLIQKELELLGKEFSRYQTRWDNLAKHIDTVQKDVKDIHVTTQKLTNKFQTINKADFKEIENKTLQI